MYLNNGKFHYARNNEIKHTITHLFNSKYIQNYIICWIYSPHTNKTS